MLQASPEHRHGDAKTEIKTETETEKKAASSSRPAPTAVIAPTTPPDTWLGDDFWRWAESKRQLAGCPPQGPPHPAKLSGWWSTARALVDVEGLKEAFLRFGDERYWQRQKPALPFGGFMSQWNDFLPVRRRNAS